MLREDQQRKETEINGINGNDGAARANIYFSVIASEIFQNKNENIKSRTRDFRGFRDFPSISVIKKRKQQVKL